MVMVMFNGDGGDVGDDGVVVMVIFNGDGDAW